MARIAVVDVETTGVNPYRHDRIIEVAAVITDSDGDTVREFTTLINPERDLGPTSLHGLSAEDVLGAPRFADIADKLIDAVTDCVAIAGHNVRFDCSFLAQEFERIGWTFPRCHSLCTMHLAGGGKLASVCRDYGVAFEGEAHSALADARATARLLHVLLRASRELVDEVQAWRAIAWPRVFATDTQPLTRDESRRRFSQPPTYIQRLLEIVHDHIGSYEEGVTAYFGLLDRVLEDRQVDADEASALVDVATHWELSTAQVEGAHRNYLVGLATAAVADGIVTDSERRDLARVAYLLGIDASQVEPMLAEAYRARRSAGVIGAKPAATEEMRGQRVCFTGECQCRLNGAIITRELASRLAGDRGLQVAPSVTRKLDVLVVADPLTQSGKAKKARSYGVRIMHEPVFWRALGVAVE